MRWQNLAKCVEPIERNVSRLLLTRIRVVSKIVRVSTNMQIVHASYLRQPWFVTVNIYCASDW